MTELLAGAAAFVVAAHVLVFGLCVAAHRGDHLARRCHHFIPEPPLRRGPHAGAGDRS